MNIVETVIDEDLETFKTAMSLEHINEKDMSCLQRRIELIKMLLEAGTNSDEENGAGMTPTKLVENITFLDITEAF